MSLSKEEINYIISCQRKSEDFDAIKTYAESFIGKPFVELITSSSEFINYLDKDTLYTYRDLLEKHCEEILLNCNIEDDEIIALLVNAVYNCRTNLGNAIVTRSPIIEKLAKNHPRQYPFESVLRYAKVQIDPEYFSHKKVREKFLQKVEYSFIKNQIITAQLLKNINKAPLFYSSQYYDTYLRNFYAGVSNGIKYGVARIEPEAFYHCWDRITIENGLQKYDVPSDLLVKLFKRYKHIPSTVEILLKCKNFTEEMFHKLVPEKYYHLYLGTNPNVSEEFLIKSYKTKKDLNWTFINRNINMSLYPKYIKILVDEGEQTAVEFNLTNTIKEDRAIYNIDSLVSMGIDLTSIKDYIVNKINNLELSS